MQSVRTNNDIEGWHRSLNRRVAGRYGLPLYMFVALLHKEARLMYAPAWLPVTIHSSAYYLPFCCFLSSLAWIVNGNPLLKIFTTVNKLDFGFQPTLHRIV